MSGALEAVALADDSNLRSALENQEPGPVLDALLRKRKSPKDLALLLSPGADGLLEHMAQTAHRMTVARFGRTVQLYGPLYVSNHCSGSCPYCGFRGNLTVRRAALSADQVLEEARLMMASGLKHILVVSGDDPKRTDIDLLCYAIGSLKEAVTSVSVEVPALDEAEYSALVEAGADGVTLYQETYDRALYKSFHRQGPKSDYRYRLEALDRAGAAGISRLTPGALWGLAPWRLEALRLGLHAKHLERTHWKSAVSIGLPRLRDVPEDFEIPSPVGDRALTHLIVALRVYLPDAGLVLSTREPAALRDRLLPLGITQMSAGSRTEPGGYANPGASENQFRVSDERSPMELADALLRLGYDPVAKDWDRALGRI